MNGTAGPERLAWALLQRAARVLPRLPPPAQQAPLAAIDAFVGDPGPAAYLRASAAMSVALRGELVEQIDGTSAERAFRDGLNALRAAPGMPAPLAEGLAGALPLDRRAGDRLHALAMLLHAYDELAARTEAEVEETRRRLRAGVPARAFRRSRT